MTTFAQAFANSCEDAARWRESKAAQEGDVRNVHAAEALRTAATWALTAADAEARLGRLLPGVIQSGTGYLLLDDQAQRLFAAYCFEGPEEFDRWLQRVAEAQEQEEYDKSLDQALGDGT